jgi:hypothetical protein
MALQISSNPVEERSKINDTIALVVILDLAKQGIAPAV